MSSAPAAAPDTGPSVGGDATDAAAALLELGYASDGSTDFDWELEDEREDRPEYTVSWPMVQAHCLEPPPVKPPGGWYAHDQAEEEKKRAAWKAWDEELKAWAKRNDVTTDHYWHYLDPAHLELSPEQQLELVERVAKHRRIASITAAATAPNAPRETYGKHLGASQIYNWLGLARGNVPFGLDGSAHDRQKLIDRKYERRSDLLPRIGRGRASHHSAGPPIGACEQGKRREPRAKEALCAFMGLEPGILQKAPDREHHALPYMSAKPDGLLGSNAVLEIKSPVRATHDCEEPYELSDATLMQVWWQLQVYHSRPTAYVVGWTEHHLHLWRVHVDNGDEAQRQCSLRLYELCKPELEKFKNALCNGFRVRPEDGISEDHKAEIRSALNKFRRLCVYLPRGRGTEWVTQVNQTPTMQWVLASECVRHDPMAALGIDRFSVPDAPGGAVACEAYMRVWWLDYKMTKYYVPEPDGAIPRSGGFIRPEYRSYDYTVPEARFVPSKGALYWGIHDGPRPISGRGTEFWWRDDDRTHEEKMKVHHLPKAPNTA